MTSMHNVDIQLNPCKRPPLMQRFSCHLLEGSHLRESNHGSFLRRGFDSSTRTLWKKICSLRPRHNLTSARLVMSVKQHQDPCSGPATDSMNYQKFVPFILIGKLMMAFLIGQSWHILKSWYTGQGPRSRILAHCLTL